MAQKKGGLGKGLGALFQDINVAVTDEDEDFFFETEEAAEGKENASGEKAASGGVTIKREKRAAKERPVDDENTVAFIDINDISPNSAQPRRRFDPEKIKELASSIREHGVIQPVVLRKKGKKYELVAGERRWRAAREAGLKTIPALVRELDERQNMLLAIIENTQREDLNPIEEAEAIKRLSEEYSLTQEEIALSLGKSRPYIANAMRLLKLPEEVRDMVSEGLLSAGHARALIAIEDEEREIELAKRAAEEKLSVREMEKLSIEESKSGKAKASRKKAKKSKKSEEIESVERELKEKLGTRVNIVKRGSKGKLEIEYYSRDELERLIELIRSIA